MIEKYLPHGWWALAVDSLAWYNLAHLDTLAEQIVNYVRPLLPDGIVQSRLECAIGVIPWSAWWRGLRHVLPSRDYLLNTVKAIVRNSVIKLFHQGMIWKIFGIRDGQVKLVPLSKWVRRATWSCT